MSSYIALSYWQLAAASVFVLINAALSVVFSLGVHRSLLFAAVRMVVQLALVGLVLTTLFSIVSPLWTSLAALVMVLFAGHEATQRQERRLSGSIGKPCALSCRLKRRIGSTRTAFPTLYPSRQTASPSTISIWRDQAPTRCSWICSATIKAMSHSTRPSRPTSEHTGRRSSRSGVRTTRSSCRQVPRHSSATIRTR